MDLAEALRRVRARDFAGNVHRVFDPEHGFLETIGSYLHGGKWNRKLRYGALYTSLEFETAVAETRRAAEKRKLALEDLGRRNSVVIRVRLARVLDLTSPDFYDYLGTSKEAMLNDEDVCLLIADQARELGYEALLVPSAAGSGINLVIFEDKLLPGWVLKEILRQEDIFLGKSEKGPARK